MDKEKKKSELNEILSTNLKQIREDRGFSLDKMSEITGVSRSMICQIERGESSPTLATIFKITNSLKISLSELTSKKRSSINVVDKNSIDPVCEDNNHFRAYTLFPFEDGKNFEIFYCEIDIGGKHISEAHQKGTEEYITVFSGILSIQVGEKEYIVPSGGFVYFNGDVLHSYSNVGSEPVIFGETIFYAQ